MPSRSAGLVHLRLAGERRPAARRTRGTSWPGRCSCRPSVSASRRAPGSGTARRAGSRALRADQRAVLGVGAGVHDDVASRARMRAVGVEGASGAGSRAASPRVVRIDSRSISASLTGPAGPQAPEPRRAARSWCTTCCRSRRRRTGTTTRTRASGSPKQRGQVVADHVRVLGRRADGQPALARRPRSRCRAPSRRRRASGSGTRPRATRSAAAKAASMSPQPLARLRADVRAGPRSMSSVEAAWGRSAAARLVDAGARPVRECGLDVADDRQRLVLDRDEAARFVGRRGVLGDDAATGSPAKRTFVDGEQRVVAPRRGRSTGRCRRRSAAPSRRRCTPGMPSRAARRRSQRIRACGVRTAQEPRMGHPGDDDVDREAALR